MAQHVDERLAHEIALLLENDDSLESIWGTLLESGFEPAAIARNLNALGGGDEEDDPQIVESSPLELTSHQQQILLGRLAIEAGVAFSSDNPRAVGRSLQSQLDQVRLGIFAGNANAADDLSSVLARIGFTAVQACIPPESSADDQWVDREIETTTPDIIVAFTMGTDRRLSEQVNAATLAADIPAIHFHLHGVQLVFGPLVIPRETACFQCFTIRREAALAPWERTLLQIPGEIGALSWPLGLDWLAIDLIKHVLKIGEPVSRGRVLTIDFLSGVPEIHTLLRVPGCPACGPPQRPAVRLWDDPV